MSQKRSGPAYDKQMAALGRILQTLRDAQNAQEAMNLTLEYVQAEFGFEIHWIGLYDSTHHRLKTKSFNIPQGARFVRTHLSLTPGDILEQVVIQGRPISVADIQTHPQAGEWAALGKQLGIKSVVIFPIRRQDVCSGILLLGSSRWGVSPTIGERSHLSVLMSFLAEALHCQEIERQRLQTKHPEQHLFKLLESLNTADGLDNRFCHVAREVQGFIHPNNTRIFWLDSQSYAFWQVGSSKKIQASRKGKEDSGLKISIDQVRDFYQTLCSDQLVVIGEAHSSLTIAASGKIMQLLRAASLMVAPILHQGELQGFLTVEGNQPRIWTSIEKQFLQGAARLLALALTVAEAQEEIRQVQSHQALTAGIVQGIHSDLDWQQILAACSSQVCEQLSAHQFLVLLFDRDLGDYELCFQGQEGQLCKVDSNWPTLDDVDWQMLERTDGAVAIEDTEHDLKLMAWHPLLQSLKARSLIVCNVSPGNAPEGVVIVADRNKRRWSPLERSLVETVSRQIGLILHQWQLQRQMDQQEHIYESIQWGLHALQQTFQIEDLERAGVDHLAKLLQAPLVALATWKPGQETAQISQSAISNAKFWVDADWSIPLSGDAIINWALQTDGILPLSFEDLPDISRSWISGPVEGRLLIIALRTAPAHHSTGVLIIAAPPERRWSDYHLQVLTLVAHQLAWSRRHLGLVALLAEQREGLEQLNWYKHHRFQEIHYYLARYAQKLRSLSSQDDSEKGQHYQQTARQLASMVTALVPVIEQEQWQLTEHYHTIPLVSLLSRLMDRVNGLVKQQQLWIKVHNESSLIVGGDISKIEFVLHELMVTACLRSQPGARIDIWCRHVNRSWLELSITDDGTLDPRLIAELRKGRPDDWLVPSELDAPPGLHYAICQLLMHEMGGELTLENLEDNRTLSRILLPIASSTQRVSQLFPRHRSR